MRQVYSSARLENVEGVAQLLRDDGIQVRITHGRSYKGSRRSEFSYREGDDNGPKPAVWVVLSEDQPRARAILRGAGLLDTTRKQAVESYLAPTLHEGGRIAATATPQRRAMRIKLGLLLAIGIALALVFIRIF